MSPIINDSRKGKGPTNDWTNNTSTTTLFVFVLSTGLSTTGAYPRESVH